MKSNDIKSEIDSAPELMHVHAPKEMKEEIQKTIEESKKERLKSDS